MERLHMYEATSQLLWEPYDTIPARNEKVSQLSQGVELSRHWIMMINTNCEDENGRTVVICQRCRQWTLQWRHNWEEMNLMINKTPQVTTSTI